MTAALDAVDADAVVVMDTDLQDPPAVSLELVERWQAGADVVYAQRRTRNDTWFKRTTADLFYRVLARTSSIEIPRNTGDYRLIDRRVVEELRRYREQNRFLRGLTSYVGFRQEAVLYDRDARYAGKSGYPLRKMVRFAGDGIFGFSTAPLVLISRIGFLFSALSLLGIVYALGVRVLTPDRAGAGLGLPRDRPAADRRHPDHHARHPRQLPRAGVHRGPAATAVRRVAARRHALARCLAAATTPADHLWAGSRSSAS